MKIAGFFLRVTEYIRINFHFKMLLTTWRCLMQLLFWPCTIASLILCIIAISTRKSKLLVISSIFILPMSLYLAATPLFLIWGLIFPLLYLGAAKFLTKKIVWAAILLVIPNFLLIGWLGLTVLNQ